MSRPPHPFALPAVQALIRAALVLLPGAKTAAAAQNRAEGQRIQLSSDGSSYGTSLDEPVSNRFASSIPGAITTATVWVRNASHEGPFLDERSLIAGLAARTAGTTIVAARQQGRPDGL